MSTEFSPATTSTVTLLKRLLLFIVLAAQCVATVAATVEYSYDANGRLVGVFAPSGDAAQYIYDAAGNIIEIKRFAATTVAVVDFTPKVGPVGATVTIYGTGFSATPASNAVTFNGTAATVSSSTINKIVTTVPSGATTGPIAVTVGGNTGTSTVNFTVGAGGIAAPTITSFSPASGVPGTTVTIVGTNFDPTPAKNTITINNTTVLASAASSTALTVTVPTYASSGKIKVRTVGGTATSATDFGIPFGSFAASDISAVNRAVVDGATATFSSASSTKVGLVVFDGVPGQSLGIGFTGLTPTNACLTVSVRKPDNLEWVASGNVSSGASVDVPSLPQAGTYSVSVVSCSGVAVSGTITVSSEVTGTIGAEGTVLGATTTRAGQNGRFTFAGTAGQKAAFYVYGLPSALQTTRLDLLLPNGQPLVSSTSTSASAYIQTQTLPVSGTYRLFVTPQTSGVGTWNIQWGQPDLIVTSFTPGAVTMSQSGAYTIPITATVKNQGTVGVKGLGWYDELYFSTDGLLDTSDARLGSSNGNADVLVNGTYNVTLSGATPTGVTPGTYTVFFKTDGWDASNLYSEASNLLNESDETNNVASSTVTLLGKPDLVASNLAVGAISVNKDGSYAIPATFTVTNSGASAAAPTWYDFAYLSTDGALDTGDRYLGYAGHSTSLAPAASYVATVSGTAPNTLTPGTYTLFVKTDGESSGAFYSTVSHLTEADETNNVLSTTITLPQRPDLTVSGLSVGSVTVNADGTYAFAVSYTVTNSGPSTAKGGWYDMAFLSTDGTLGTTDPYVGYTYRSTDLAAGASYVVNIPVTAANTIAPGTYTLIAKTDTNSSGAFWTANDSQLAESDETNNAIATSVNLPTRPDLIVTAGPTIGTITVNTDGSYSIPVSFTVQNNGGSTAQPSWYDECYLSSDGTLDTTDFYIGYASRTTSLAAGASYVVNITCRTLTTTTAGNYTLFVKADGYDSGGKYSTYSSLFESNDANNAASVSITLPTKP